MLHQCHAYERVMVAVACDDGPYCPRSSPPYPVPCETWMDEFGWWSLAGCADFEPAVCEVCIEAVDIFGTPSVCGDVVGVVYDQP